MSDAGKVAVYYNSACPVCRSGIDLQKGAMGACAVEWIDVHAHPEAVDELGVNLEAVRERLYVRDAEGVKIGADAAAALWSHTRGLRWLARLLAHPRMRAGPRVGGASAPSFFSR